MQQKICRNTFNIRYVTNDNMTYNAKIAFLCISVNSRSSVLYMNRRDSITILIKISWGIYWPSLYLQNLSNSLLHQRITMAYFIRSLIYLFLNVCCCELSWAATTRPANVNKLPKMVFLLAKIVFMSKVLDSWSNDLQRFGRYKVGQ